LRHHKIAGPQAFSLPRAVLMPLIIPLGVIGAFAVHLSHFDIYVMFTAGFAG
jgi:putative tricarboxylic transport membrane protein